MTEAVWFKNGKDISWVDSVEAVEIEQDSISDCLTIGVDFSPNDRDMLVVMRKKGDEIHIVNMLKDEEAVEVYNKLIGKDKR